jgi:hypothetical protein
MLRAIGMNILSGGFKFVDELTFAALILIFLFLLYIKIRQDKKN